MAAGKSEKHCQSRPAGSLGVTSYRAGKHRKTRFHRGLNYPHAMVAGRTHDGGGIKSLAATALDRTVTFPITNRDFWGALRVRARGKVRKPPKAPHRFFRKNINARSSDPAECGNFGVPLRGN